MKRSLPFVALLAVLAASNGSHETMEQSRAIRDQQYAELNAWLNAQLAEAPKARAAYWRLDFSSRANYERSLEPYRRDWAAMLGVPPGYSGPFHEKRTKVADYPAFTMYRVWFDAWPGVRTFKL